MKISKIVVMKNLDTGKSEEIKLDTKEIREFNFPKKDYIINKVFIDNLWLKITLLVWLLILSALLILAKISQNYGFLSMLILISLITITLISNFDIIRLYFLGEKTLNIKKRLITSWVWIYVKEAELPKNTEAERRVFSFVKKALREINKFAIRFYLSHIAIALTLLCLLALLIIENQPDERVSIFVVVAWIFTEFYLWRIRCFIRDRAKMPYNLTTRVDNGITVLKFSLNGNYAIEEEISLIFKDCKFFS